MDSDRILKISDCYSSTQESTPHFERSDVTCCIHAQLKHSSQSGTSKQFFGKKNRPLKGRCKFSNNFHLSLVTERLIMFHLILNEISGILTIQMVQFA